MKRYLLTTLIVFMLASTSLLANTELTVYSDQPQAYITAYTQAFNKLYPDIKLNWLNDSAGPITARLIAEKENPKADVIFGLALTSIYILDKHDLLETFKIQNSEEMLPVMLDKAQNKKWVASNAWTSSLCVNSKEMERLNLPHPTSWEDLLNPIYKGHIIAPSPTTSSIGYMTVYNWINVFGEEKAWEYMEQLNKNVKMYSLSGCRVGQMAAQGEIPIGLSSPLCIGDFLEMGAPIDIIYPSEGLAWDPEAVALIKGSKNLEAAKKLINFATTDEVAEIGKKLYSTPTKISYQDESSKLLSNIDFEKAASERERIIQKWRKHFDTSN